MDVTKVRGILHDHKVFLSHGISSRRLCRKWLPGASPLYRVACSHPGNVTCKFVNARDVHPDVSYWIWQSSKFYGTLVTVVTHFPSALLLHYFKLYYFDILLYIQAINSRYTHLFKDMCYYYLTGLYTLNVHVESFVTVGNETYLGYLLQTAHMFPMKLTWFITPDFLCSHLCFFVKKCLPVKGQVHLAEHQGNAASPRCLPVHVSFLKIQKKKLSKGHSGIFCKMFHVIKVILIYSWGSAVANNTKSSHLRIL